jgi:hypothetical protein
VQGLTFDVIFPLELLLQSLGGLEQSHAGESSSSRSTDHVRIDRARLHFEGTVDDDMCTRRIENLSLRAILHREIPQMIIVARQNPHVALTQFPAERSVDLTEE